MGGKSCLTFAGRQESAVSLCQRYGLTGVFELAQFYSNWSSPNARKAVILFGEPFTKITFHLV